jgi:hypothetical protein
LIRLKSDGINVTADGPYLETKEALTGYMIFEAENLQTAAEIAKKCPALTHGEFVEIAELVNHG